MPGCQILDQAAGRVYRVCRHPKRPDEDVGVAAWQRGQRCIQVASGFYEWHVGADTRKQPFFIHLADREIFGFAALWDRSFTAEGAAIESCAHITMAGNSLMRDIHNAGSHPYRMPAILRMEDHDAWLNGTIDEAQKLLVQYPSDLMVAYAVSTHR